MLWLSGGVRGEAGRIWLPWMPFACLFAAQAIIGWGPSGGWAERPGARDVRQVDEPDGGQADARDGWRVGATAAILATEAALAVALAASMTFIS